MGKSLALDSSIFIYLLEENPQYLAIVQKIFHAIWQKKYQGLFSVIGMIEILTGPKKKARFDLAWQYKEKIASFPNLLIKGINENIVELASDLRAKYGLNTPDAIHLATAIDAQAKFFITNDKKLTRVTEIQVKILPVIPLKSP